jgi:hypothetical protein
MGCKENPEACHWLLAFALALRRYVLAAFAFDAAFCLGLRLGWGMHVPPTAGAMAAGSAPEAREWEGALPVRLLRQRGAFARCCPA